MPDPTVNERGMTELHLAAYHGELDWVTRCLAGGLSVHATDVAGYTPLCWAADMGVADGDREAVVEALIAAGSDVNARVGDETVLAIAKRAGNAEIVRLLVTAGALD
jgi:ankyrin repeat protein